MNSIITRCLAAVLENRMRIGELDAVRGAAACAVLLFHLPLGFWPGATGVDLFFVLSGYLITSIILREGERPRFLAVFYFRRSLRIFPIYYLALLIVFALNAVRRNPDPTDGAWRYFFYLQNVEEYWSQLPTSTISSLGHTWTLAIEEQFYLIWPALILLLRPRNALYACMVLAMTPLVLRFGGLSGSVLAGHCDGLALGALLAFIGRSSKKAFRPANVAVYVGALGCGFAGCVALWGILSENGEGHKQATDHPLFTTFVSLAYFGLVGAILCLIGTRWTAPLRFRPLIWIGTVSYGLYLYHWIIYELLDTVFKFGRGYQDPWWLDILKVALTFGAATVSWYLIELPISRQKERFSYKCTDPSTTTTCAVRTFAEPNAGELQPITK